MDSLSLEVLKKGVDVVRLVGLVLRGGWLDQMILVVFSNLNELHDCVIGIRGN